MSVFARILKRESFARLETITREISVHSYCPDVSYYCNGSVSNGSAFCLVQPTFGTWQPEYQEKMVREFMDWCKFVEHEDYEIVTEQ